MKKGSLFRADAGVERSRLNQLKDDRCVNYPSLEDEGEGVNPNERYPIVTLSL